MAKKDWEWLEKLADESFERRRQMWENMTYIIPKEVQERMVEEANKYLAENKTDERNN